MLLSTTTIVNCSAISTKHAYATGALVFVYAMNRSASPQASAD